MWETIKYDLIILVFGVVIGGLITRYYYEKTKHYSIAKLITGAMINDNIDELVNYCNDLEQILSKMTIETDNLLSQIKKTADIETENFTNSIEEMIETSKSNEQDKDAKDT